MSHSFWGASVCRHTVLQPFNMKELQNHFESFASSNIFRDVKSIAINASNKKSFVYMYVCVCVCII